MAIFSDKLRGLTIFRVELTDIYSKREFSEYCPVLSTMFLTFPSYTGCKYIHYA